MTLDEMREAADLCRFDDWQILVLLDDLRPYLQVSCPSGTCNVTGAPNPWWGRKWFLSPHMTPSEVVQTAFKAVLTAMEHEVRERFTYRGAAIFGPHFDVERLVDLCGQPGSTEERPPPPAAA